MLVGTDGKTSGVQPLGAAPFFGVRHSPDRRRAIHTDREPPSRRAPVTPDLQVTKAGSRDTYHPKKRQECKYVPSYVR